MVAENLSALQHAHLSEIVAFWPNSVLTLWYSVVHSSKQHLNCSMFSLQRSNVKLEVANLKSRFVWLLLIDMHTAVTLLEWHSSKNYKSVAMNVNLILNAIKSGIISHHHFCQQHVLLWWLWWWWWWWWYQMIRWWWWLLLLFLSF